MTAVVPPRVDAGVKAALLDLVDGAIADGWAASRACAVLELDGRRWRRWRHRRAAGRLDDSPGGGRGVHAITPGEQQAMLELFDAWGDIGGGYRKLAHRGSYEGLVWVSPSTLYRVLADQGLVLPARPQRSPAPARPMPHWVRWERHQIWIYDNHALPPREPGRLRHLGRRYPQMARHPRQHRRDRHTGRSRLLRRSRHRRTVAAHRSPPSQQRRRRQRRRGADPAGHERQRPPDARRHHTRVLRHVLHRRALRPPRHPD